MSVKLRWEKQKQMESWWAYRGQHVVGMVVCVTGVSSDSPRYGLYRYQVQAITTKWITKGYGDCKTEAGAKRAVQRAFDDWCAAFELTGIEDRK